VAPCLEWRTSLQELEDPVEQGERTAAFIVVGIIVVFIAITVAGSFAGWWL
jgi:hypothetical protein